MKGLNKVMATVARVLGQVVGNNVATASGGAFKQFPHLSFAA